MNKKIRRDILLLLLIILFSIIVIFAIVKLVTSNPEEEKSSFPLSIKTEKVLGKLIKQQLRIDPNIVDAPITKKALEVMKDILLKDSSPLPYDIEIFLVESNAINAVALPGGTILIYSGLIKATENPQEVIAVLAHELGHIYYRDSYNSVIRSIGLSVLLSALTGDANQLTSKIINNLLAKSYSRELEGRADDFALELLAHKGIDPIYMASFFQRLEKLYNEKDSKTSITNYFSTHPASNARIEKAQKASQSFLGTDKAPTFDWDKIQKEQSSFF